ncbi:exonuclease domain-containing protein [Candidatus Uabimicrobium sp. HlEnr_7]|uniref:exonuclease domain-containing protein n=1 Tax=Candidatus Uabimicrobium helgolandensis TaxID=3095367 RepID=UPI0035581A22
METANTNPASICSIGIVEVQNGTIQSSKHFFIRPKRLVFNPRNTAIHGITEEDVKDQPKLNELWPTLRNYIDGQKVVAHNASFDMAAIRRALDEYKLTYPNCDYICTKNMSKKYLPNSENYKLSTLSEMYDIELQHHNALSDAKACAKLAIKFCVESNMNCVAQFSEELSVEVKKIRSDDERYSILNPRKSKFGNSVKISDIQVRAEKFDKDHVYFGKKFCFTGTLKSMERKDAMQAVVDIGGLVTNSMGKNVQYLVMGDGGKDTSKHKTALKLKKENYDVTIILENQFLQHVNINNALTKY